MKTNLNRKVIVRFNNFEKEGIITAERISREPWINERERMWYNVSHDDGSISLVLENHLTYLYG